MTTAGIVAPGTNAAAAGMLRRLPCALVLLAIVASPAAVHASSGNNQSASSAAAAKPASASHGDAKDRGAEPAKGHGKAADTPAESADARTAAKSHLDAARTAKDFKALDERIQRRLAEARRAQKEAPAASGAHATPVAPAARAARSATSDGPRPVTSPSRPHATVAPQPPALSPPVHPIWHTHVIWLELQR